jgi:hypothetical protein
MRWQADAVSPARTLAALVLAALFVVAGTACGGSGGGSTSAAATTTAATTTPSGQVSHAAPDLEALLPSKAAGTRLQKGSTTGATVFGSGDAFSRSMTRQLAAAGKAPVDLRFANAQDPKGKLELEVGVFEVKGMSAAALGKAIVVSSRPNAPGLAVGNGTVAGKPVTKLVYPGGTVLYLYEHGDRVFYVGTQSASIAGAVLEQLP